MDKKELKFYEAPACDVVELELQGMLCASTEIEDEHWRAPEMGEVEE